MRLYLINPSNSIASRVNIIKGWLNRYRVWKPLGLLVLAGLTPTEWDITVLDENLSVPALTRLRPSSAAAGCLW
jgi:hypothetical protein